MKHVFGKSITHRERFLIGDEVVIPLVTAGLVSGRIYTAQPTDSQITGHTGHIAGSEVTTWTQEGDEMQIEFPALTDPNPSSATDYEIYYIALNFKYQSGGEEKWIVRPVIVWRPDSMVSKIKVQALDVWAKEDRIRVIRGPETTWTDAKIKDAITIVTAKLTGEKGYNLKNLGDLGRLNTATAYLATALCCLDLASTDAALWMPKYQVYSGLYDTLFKTIPVGHDVDGDGVITPDEKTASSSDQWVTR